MSSCKKTKDKQARRLRRRRHIRKGIFGTTDHPRLTVFRSHNNIYCQLIDDQRGMTLASASSLQKDVSGQLQGSTGNSKAAVVVGKVLAERALALGIKRAQFDRNGYRFHGRVKALAEAARSAGLKI